MPHAERALNAANGHPIRLDVAEIAGLPGNQDEVIADRERRIAEI